ncbi:MAG: MFS transporter [Polyangiaceae bacterium]|nr:MFS transporter [Polyangiaceae bacterium]
MSTGQPQREAPDEAFLAALRGAPPAPRRRPLDERIAEGTSLTGRRALELFESQIISRHLDYEARALRARGAGFYTIGSAGHEGNVAVAAATTPHDPALLHYRSGAFFVERARQRPDAVDPVRDILLGLCSSSDEPIAGGRHKVFGSKPLEIIPQTSTIASHLPRAVGLAIAIDRAKKLGVVGPYAPPAIVVASFGDASANHSTLTGAVQSATLCAYRGVPVPVLFVCEDNGIGISVETPPGWIRAAYGARQSLRYCHADGCDLGAAHDAAQEAAAFVRRERRPAFLHLDAVRLMGHAGSDAENAYRTPEQIRGGLERDPLVRGAKMLIESGVATPEEILELYERVRRRVEEMARHTAAAPRLTTAAQVTSTIAPRRPGAVAAEVARSSAAGGPSDPSPATLSVAIGRTLADLAAACPELLVFGEDVAKKGGVYGVTKGLQKRFGVARVFDTVLDEQSILGVGLGAALAGFVPVPEIQYLAYLHNAEDQLRGEAATLSFFSQGAYKNGIVIRIAGYGYQKGFGGHFHNDNAVGVLRDIPGIVIASPSRPEDAAAMLRTCVAAAKVDGTVSVFLEPIALYHTRDLHEEGDGGWLGSLAPSGVTEIDHVPIGRARVHGDGADLTMITFGNGVHACLRVAERLAAEGIHARVVDLRWLAPLPIDDLLSETRLTGRALVVDETRRTGGVSEGVVTALIDAGYSGKLARVASEDSFIPLGDAALLVLLSETTILDAARALVCER